MRQFNIALILMAVMLSACSTVNRGYKDHFRIDTVPQGASVTTSVIDNTRKKRQKNQYGRYAGSNAITQYHGCRPTPCAIELPRRSEFVVTLEHPDYEPTELFVRSTSMKGGTTANAAANIATASGTSFALVGMAASFSAAYTPLLSLGTQSVNASGIATTGATAGLGIGVGMIAIDIATGANLNLFPNPVVIELAPKGSAVKTDPLVGLHKNMIKAKSISEAICAKRKKDIIAGEPTCKEARTDYKNRKESFQRLKRQQLDELKAAIKAAKAQQRAADTP